MLVKELFNPASIVVAGASNDIEKIGGKVLKNILEGNFSGKIFGINPKEKAIQGISCFANADECPPAELAIIATASGFVSGIMEALTQKGTKAFVVLSAGFSEIGQEGKLLEEKITGIVDSVGGTLIGPNCIGLLTPYYQATFAGLIPKLDSKGVDFVTGSGSTAAFIIETVLQMGLTFASLYSVGNSAQTGVEKILEYWDDTFDTEASPKVKIIYIEKIDKRAKLLKNAKSLIRKGCRLAAIKAGTTEAGSRAVSSHTGALACSDLAVDALFKKAGIIRCYGRLDLAYVAGVLSYKPLNGKRFAIVTHAGGPGVMLTDKLTKEGFEVPHLHGSLADELLSKLFHGSSVANPIDFLATGNDEQLGMILDNIEKFDEIDNSVVIFGSTGLFDITEVYRVLNEKINTLKKPVYPLIASPNQAHKEFEYFKSLGNVCLLDEVQLGEALSKIYHTPEPEADIVKYEFNTKEIRNSIENLPDGYLPPGTVRKLLSSVGIPCVEELVVNFTQEAVRFTEKIGYPVVMKVVGPTHKSEVGGVRISIKSSTEVGTTFNDLMEIDGATSVLIQKQMVDGIELFAGAKYEKKFGHIILFGLGGIFIEVLKDFSSSLAPVGFEEASRMIKSLKSYKIIQGTRGKPGADETQLARIICGLSGLLHAVPEIVELDINPLICNGNNITAVDARICIER